jgi:short-subunit dehydrogenase
MSPERRLVLVTGASAGIGRETVRLFAGRGDRVIAVARTVASLETLATELGGPENVVALAADVADADSTSAMVSRVQEQLGTPDVIVANAGIGLDARFTETTDAALRSVFEVNVFGLVRSIRPFVPGMLERGSGRLLLISSIVGKRGTPHYSAYSASKFALDGIADALRAELWGTGVSVGVIYPSSTRTEFQDRLLREGPSQKRVRPRQHTASSVAQAIVEMADSRRRERVLSFEAKLLCFADSIAPGLIDRMLARMLTSKGDAD